ncbi:hypothetical protein OMD46_16670 [Pseudomonas sp. MDMC_285]|nr:hypothetical protein [Pseudomonas sp. MDMC_285]
MKIAFLAIPLVVLMAVEANEVNLTTFVVDHADKHIVAYVVVSMLDTRQPIAALNPLTHKSPRNPINSAQCADEYSEEADKAEYAAVDGVA